MGGGGGGGRRGGSGGGGGVGYGPMPDKSSAEEFKPPPSSVMKRDQTAE